MRKIEKEMNNAIQAQRNFTKSNTSVRVDEVASGIEITVCLHGNLIATIKPEKQEMQLSSAGWETVTTKSRLNALLADFTNGAYGIYQRNYEWFLDTPEGDIPFESGVTIPTLLF